MRVRCACSSWAINLCSSMLAAGDVYMPKQQKQWVHVSDMFAASALIRQSCSHQIRISCLSDRAKKVPHASVQTLVRIKGSFLQITAVSMNFSWWIFKMQIQKCFWKHKVLLKLLLIISAKPSQRLYVFLGLFPALLRLWSPIKLTPFSQGSVQVNVWCKILNSPLVTNCPLYLQLYCTVLGGSQKWQVSKYF